MKTELWLWSSIKPFSLLICEKNTRTFKIILQIIQLMTISTVFFNGIASTLLLSFHFIDHSLLIRYVIGSFFDLWTSMHVLFHKNFLTVLFQLRHLLHVSLRSGGSSIHAKYLTIQNSQNLCTPAGRSSFFNDLWGQWICYRSQKDERSPNPKKKLIIQLEESVSIERHRGVEDTTRTYFLQLERSWNWV